MNIWKTKSRAMNLFLCIFLCLKCHQKKMFLCENQPPLLTTIPIDIEQTRYLFVALDFNADTKIDHYMADCEIRGAFQGKNHLCDKNKKKKKKLIAKCCHATVTDCRFVHIS